MAGDSAIDWLKPDTPYHWAGLVMIILGMRFIITLFFAVLLLASFSNAENGQNPRTILSEAGESCDNTHLQAICINGAICVNNICRKPRGIGEPCDLFSKDCSNGLKCDDGTCRESKLYESCYFNIDCESRNCVNETCIEKEDLTFCNGAAGSFCYKDVDCQEALKCATNVCTEGNEGDLCTFDIDCKAGLKCGSKMCSLGGESSLCDRDSDCQKGLECFTGERRCRELKVNSWYCAAGFKDCPKGTKCIPDNELNPRSAGSCSDGSIGASCNKDADCKNGISCFEGICSKKGSTNICRDVSDCQEGMICSNIFKSPNNLIAGWLGSFKKEHFLGVCVQPNLNSCIISKEPSSLNEELPIDKKTTKSGECIKESFKEVQRKEFPTVSGRLILRLIDCDNCEIEIKTHSRGSILTRKSDNKFITKEFDYNDNEKALIIIKRKINDQEGRISVLVDLKSKGGDNEVLISSAQDTKKIEGFKIEIKQKYGIDVVDTDAKWSQYELELIKQALEELPASFLEKMPVKKIVRKAPFLDRKGLVVNRDPTTVEIHDGALLQGTYSPEQEFTSGFKGQMVHEITHTVQLNGYNGIFSNQYENPILKSFMDAVGWKVGLYVPFFDSLMGIFGRDFIAGCEPSVFPSEYASANPKEDMAESVAFYVYDPEYLSEISPARYSWIKQNLFDGKEFK
ncbi:hypothetical protein HYY72_00035 [Candidatus Woesearchaeota archaeon]|nr:hypothetical protein [Candidatus Woesearchaeota archaeon]